MGAASGTRRRSCRLWSDWLEDALQVDVGCAPRNWSAEAIRSHRNRKLHANVVVDLYRSRLVDRGRRNRRRRHGILQFSDLLFASTDVQTTSDLAGQPA